MAGKVLIAGGTGLIGSALRRVLVDHGWLVKLLGRDARSEFIWNPAEAVLDEEALKWPDAVINLAGAGINDKRWSRKRKDDIRSSRLTAARLLVKGLSSVSHRVKTFISPSASGYYGNGGTSELSEESPPGNDFLAQTCVLWEKETMEVQKAGIRTVILRAGAALAREGGALPVMAMPVNFMLAPFPGNGKQHFPWIHIHDLCLLYRFALEKSDIQGIFNAAAPRQVTVRDIMTALSRTKKRKTIPVPIPLFALRAILGEIAYYTLYDIRLSSARIVKAGYRFSYPDIDSALADIYV